MSHLGDVVWVSREPLCDPMREFGVEQDDDPTRPVPGETLFRRVAAVSRIALPQAPAFVEPAPAPELAQTAQFTPTAEPAPGAAIAEPSAAVHPAAAQRGRWFVGVAALALLTLGQTPFVVLWALQALDGPAPMAIQVEKPPVAFASAAPVPVERTLPPPPRPAAPAPKPVPAGALSGWVRIEVPVAMRIFEAGRLLGSTDVDRLMLPTGDHLLDLRSDELGYATRQLVTVKAGETALVPVRLPSASISINARPWAEVWVDGERVGDTPIGTLMRPIGRHEVVLRHPELGERRVPVMVSLTQPARVSVDFKTGK